MVDLNRYMTKTLHLLIVDDATFSHTFSHLHDISIAITISQHLYSHFSPFHLPVKEKEKQWRMKGLNMVQWINFNQNNKSVLVCQYSALWKNWPYPPIASVFYSRQAGWQTDKIQVDFSFFKILYRFIQIQYVLCLILMQYYYCIWISLSQVKLILRQGVF